MLQRQTTWVVLCVACSTTGCASQALSIAPPTPLGDSEVMVCWENDAVRIARLRAGALPLSLIDLGPPDKRTRAFLRPAVVEGPLAGECMLLLWRVPPQPPSEFDGTRISIYQRERTAGGSRLTRLQTVLLPPSLPDEDSKPLLESMADPRGRELEVWSVSTDGQRGVRLSTAKPPTDFPLFALEGQQALVALKPAEPQPR